jgi:hypothetical protein
MGYETPPFSRRTRLVWALFFAASPLVLMTAYLAISRGMVDRWSGATDYSALAVSVAVGLSGVWVLPCSRLARALLSLLYGAGALILLFAWSLGFVCAAFGDCL